MNAKLGTAVIADDGFNETLCQICDVVTDRWGTHMVAAVVGTDEFKTIHTLNPAGHRGIGFRIATEAEAARCHRYLAAK